MEHLSFARKYRPQTFKEIIGQDHVVTILENAVQMNRVAHAYIFSGQRGLGKTTTARIFAKALGCEKGPTTRPCNACPSCAEITQSSSIDVLEIDGASNRGIDEIRNLRDNVKFAPSKGSYKIYIIDEVHMLTPEAFNALLKTLEEPPQRVVFVFATTRINKIPATILSRCQRLDFRKIPAGLIISSLRRICEAEQLSAADEALSVIARYSDGCLRDAEVLLDQLATFTRGKIAAQDAARLLGLVDEDLLFGLTDTIMRSDPAAALKIIDGLITDGKEITQVISGLIGHFRDLAIVRMGESAAGLIDASPETVACLKEQAGHFTVEDILYAVAVFSNALDFIRKTQTERIPLEMAMIKLCRRSSVASFDALMKKVEALEARLAGPASASSAEPRQEFRQFSGAAASAVGSSPAKEPPRPQEAPAARTERAAEKEEHPHGDVNVGLQDIQDVWQAIVDQVCSRKMSVGSYLMDGRPVNLNKGQLTIGFSKNSQFHKEVLEHVENRHVIESIISDIVKAPIRVILVIEQDREAPEAPRNGFMAGSESSFKSDAQADLKDSVMFDPIVKDAMDIFKGEIKGLGRKNLKEK